MIEDCFCFTGTVREKNLIYVTVETEDKYVSVPKQFTCIRHHTGIDTNQFGRNKLTSCSDNQPLIGKNYVAWFS